MYIKLCKYVLFIPTKPDSIANIVLHFFLFHDFINNPSTLLFFTSLLYILRLKGWKNCGWINRINLLKRMENISSFVYVFIINIKIFVRINMFCGRTSSKTVEYFLYLNIYHPLVDVSGKVDEKIIIVIWWYFYRKIMYHFLICGHMFRKNVQCFRA